MSPDFDPRTYYMTLCQELADNQLQQKIIHYMARHGYIGHDNRVSRQELASALLSEYTTFTDRKIRKAKENSPILSSSGKAGYFLPASQWEINKVINENKRRIQSLKASNAALSKIELPYTPPQPTKPQMNLWRELAL